MAEARTHPDLEAEQRYLDHAYACLAAMRERAERLKDLGFQGIVYSDGMIVDDKAWDAEKQRRLDLLAESPTALCFGRIDPAGPARNGDAERWYIGRRHVEDADGQPVVTDWRAPVATPFYRATLADPMGLRLRRRFLVEGRHLVDAFDEDFTDPSTVDAVAYVPDPLLAELERARTGEMRDIVATIQAEQDVIIRAPLDECIVVQGGPGTGKTAVGLHRAAFLLYEHRDRLELERLLIVGPNRLFLRYISQVLPSLGETASVQITVEGLAGNQYRPRAEDPPELARLKGDARMAELVRRAIFGRITPPGDDVRVTTSFGWVSLPASEVRVLLDAALAGDRPANVSREVLREQVLALAWRLQSGKPTASPAHQSGFLAEVRASREFKSLLDRMWPAMSPVAVVRRLYGNRRELTRLSTRLLSSDEVEMLVRRPARRVAEEAWSHADLAVLDEAEALLNGATVTYGHVVVDEAQDLSAMELRMVARRSRDRSMTVLGDLAQAASPAAQTHWEDAIEHLMAPKARIEELDVGYRVPAPILDFANRLLPEAAPHVLPARSVRLKGEPPRVLSIAAHLLTDVAGAAVAQLAGDWESVGVVGPQSLLDDISHGLDAVGIAFSDARAEPVLGEHVTLLPPTATKGLEFDAVVVVEPSRIVAEEPSGVRILYVALTRAVQRLVVVHSEPLPKALARAR